MLNIAKIRKEWFLDQVESLKESGIPYSEIATRLGIRPQYLNSIKNSERGASENLTVKLCKAFNINYNDLLLRISSHDQRPQDVHMVNEPVIKTPPTNRVPLYKNSEKIPINIDKETEADRSTINSREWIDAGDLFPDATFAVHHYGDSMNEYPSGSILIVKQLMDVNLIIWGRNYYVETADVGFTKRLQDGGKKHVIGYSSNDKRYPDGRLVHEPVEIPKESIRRISLILGCVTKEFSKGVIPVSR